MTTDLNSIIINNYYVVIDTFFSNKYNSIVVVLNNRHNIKKNTNIDISDDIRYILNNEEIKLTNPTIKDYIHLDNINLKNTVFKNNFHIEILYKPNVTISAADKSNEFKIIIGKEKEKEITYCFNLSPPCSDFIKTKCITTIFKDEYHLIDSWIEYHKKIGFEKFILYDNCSNNKYLSNTKDIIFIKAKWNYWDTDSFRNRSTIGQVIQQNHCLWKYCPQFLALTDLDEYINPHPNKINIFDDKVSVLSIPNYFFDAADKNNFKLEDSLYRENNCGNDGKTKLYHRKCIIYSQNVDLFCVHTPIQFQNIHYASFDEVQLNHYANLSSKLRNKNNYTQKDDTIVSNLRL